MDEITAVAMALHTADESDKRIEWRHLSGSQKRHYRDLARAAISAMDEPPELTLPDIIDRLEQWRKEGAACRDDGTTCPYPAHTLAYYMHGCGWLRRDLQLALCKSNEGYRKSQIDHGSVTEENLK